MFVTLCSETNLFQFVPIFLRLVEEHLLKKRRYLHRH